MFIRLHVTDRRTDGIAVGITALCIASNAAALKKNARVIAGNKVAPFYQGRCKINKVRYVISYLQRYAHGGI